MIEDYLFDPAQRTGPKPSTAVGPNDLLDKYRTLRVLYYEDVDDASDFGKSQEDAVGAVRRPEGMTSVSLTLVRRFGAASLADTLPQPRGSDATLMRGEPE